MLKCVFWTSRPNDVRECPGSAPEFVVGPQKSGFHPNLTGFGPARTSLKAFTRHYVFVLGLRCSLCALSPGQARSCFQWRSQMKKASAVGASRMISTHVEICCFVLCDSITSTLIRAIEKTRSVMGLHTVASADKVWYHHQRPQTSSVRLQAHTPLHQQPITITHSFFLKFINLF